jgi:hypothetical protein
MAWMPGHGLECVKDRNNRPPDICRAALRLVFYKSDLRHKPQDINIGIGSYIEVV